MANAHQQMVVHEPLFKGGRDTLGALPQGSCSPEDFIIRVEGLALGAQWDDAQAAAHARSYLREEAQDWFRNVLPVANPEAYTRSQTSFIAFKAAFKTAYFSVKDTVDVSTDWSSLTQRPREKGLYFCYRAVSTIKQYAELLPEIAPTAGEVETLAVLVDAHVQEHTQATRAAFNRGLNQVFNSVSRRTYTRMVNDLSVKIMAAGLKQPKLIETVRSEERKGHDVEAIFRAVDNAERNLGKRDNLSVIPRSTIPVASVEDPPQEGDLGDMEDATILDAVRNMLRQRGQRHPGPKQTKPAPPASKPAKGETSAPHKKQSGIGKTKTGEPYYCTHCNGRVGHVLRACPKKATATKLDAFTTTAMQLYRDTEIVDAIEASVDATSASEN